MFIWAFLEKNAPFLLGFGFSLVLARMVPPEAYGLVAMTAVFVALGTVIQNMGFGAALIQRENPSPDDVKTVFIANLGLGAVVALTLAVAAGTISRFYEQPELVDILYATAATLFIISIGTIQSVQLQRQFLFRTGLIVDTAATVVAGSSALVLAFYGYNVWALVVLALVRELVRTALLWHLVPRDKGGRFDLQVLRGLWPFSRHMVGASLYHHLATNLSSVLLGKFYSATALGLFARAQSLQTLPLTLIGGPLQRVAFPLYSRHQHDRAGLLLMLRGHIRIVAVVGGFLMAQTSINAREIVLILVGKMWLSSAPILATLSYAIFFSMLFPLHSEANKAIGHSLWFFRAEMIKKTILVAAVIAGVLNGVEGLAWALVAVSVSDYLLSAASSVRFLNYRWRDHVADFLPALAISLLSIVIATLVGSLLPAAVPALTTIVKGSIVVVIFAIAVLMFGGRLFPEAHAGVRSGMAKILRAPLRSKRRP